MNKENIADHEQVISLGNKLSFLRKQLGLSKADIASTLHIHSYLIQCIENDETLHIPDVFFKSYVKSYAAIVGLPIEEYLPFLTMKSKQQPKRKMKNYSQKPQQKRLGKIIFMMTILIILLVLGVTGYSIWKDNQNNYIEISHYISPQQSSNAS